MNVLIVEDKTTHYTLIENGVKELGTEYNIIEIDIDDIIEMIKNNDLTSLHKKIELFIVDVSLEKTDELGLQFINLLKKEKYNNKNYTFIVASVWERDEFETVVKIPDNQFIDKNNFDGFELSIEVRNTIYKLCGK